MEFANGVNCTMMVPYTPENKIDYFALDKMLDWYVAHGCSSFFAMCHSTELHLLSMEERLGIIRFVEEKSASLVTIRGRRPDIIAAGTFSTDISAMAEEIEAVSEAGADAVVWITNRLDPEREGDGVWLDRGARLLEKVDPSIKMGLYECPMPYKRLLTPKIIRWALDTGRFYFIKDTCCDMAMLRERLALVRGTRLKLFNANAQTLLESLQEGACGYSSVMANIHPELYAWLCDNFEKYPEEAAHLQHALCFSSFVETLSYPLVAKYVMRKQGVPVELLSRMRDKDEFIPYHAYVMDELMDMTRWEYRRLPGDKLPLWQD